MEETGELPIFDDVYVFVERFFVLVEYYSHNTFYCLILIEAICA